MNEAPDATPRPGASPEPLRGAPTAPLDLMRRIGMFERRAGEELFRVRALTTEQGRALIYVVQNPGAKQREIAEFSCRGAASVSNLLQGLDRRGLIERRTEDGDERSERVYATQAGHNLVTGLETAMSAVSEALLSPLSPSERQTLVSLLSSIAARYPIDLP